MEQNPGNIVMPNVPNFKLSPSILSALPIFEGLKNENPHKHLRNLHRVCMALFGNSTNLDNIKLTLFSHSLGDAPREWLNHLQGGPFEKFEDIATRFIQRYFPDSLTAKLRKDITGMSQESVESLQEYYERFVLLCASCPNHVLEERTLIDQFLSGMNYLENRLLMCTVGGSIDDKTPSQVRKLIEKIAQGNQGWGMGDQVNMANVVDFNALESRLSAKLDTKLNQVLNAAGAKLEPKKCGLCGLTDHATDECPVSKRMGNQGGYGYQKPQYTYDAGRKYPNLRWRMEENQVPQQQYQRQGLYIHPNAQAQHSHPTPTPPQNT
ncbi:hypothetical protein LUZ60_005875 [Juncus effusus]|nr:hypothetical protein LUZ60_005875 [Juncus effusus]